MGGRFHGQAGRIQHIATNNPIIPAISESGGNDIVNAQAQTTGIIDIDQAARAIERGGYRLSPGAADGSRGWVASILIFKGAEMLGDIRVNSSGPATRTDGGGGFGSKATLNGVPEVLLSTIGHILETTREAYSKDMYRLLDASPKK